MATGSPAPLHLRVAVVAGAVVVLLGVVGMFWIPGTDERATFVRIEGLPADPGGRAFTLSARWEKEAGARDKERGTPGRQTGDWIFYRSPTDRDVTLTLRQAGAMGPEVLQTWQARLSGRKALILRRGE